MGSLKDGLIENGFEISIVGWLTKCYRVLPVFLVSKSKESFLIYQFADETFYKEYSGKQLALNYENSDVIRIANYNCALEGAVLIGDTYELIRLHANKFKKFKENQIPNNFQFKKLKCEITEFTNKFIEEYLQLD